MSWLHKCLVMQYRLDMKCLRMKYRLDVLCISSLQDSGKHLNQPCCTMRWGSMLDEIASGLLHNKHLQLLYNQQSL